MTVEFRQDPGQKVTSDYGIIKDSTTIANVRLCTGSLKPNFDTSGAENSKNPSRDTIGRYYLTAGMEVTAKKISFTGLGKPLSYDNETDKSFNKYGICVSLPITVFDGKSNQTTGYVRGRIYPHPRKSTF